MNRPLQFGGCFAPPLTDEKIDRYEELAAGAEPAVADAMENLLTVVKKWWNLPESTKSGTPHASGRGVMVPLEDEHIAAIDNDMPWRDELNAFAARFDTIDPVSEKELRDAAHHLLWFANELYHDPDNAERPEFGREPITNDRI